MKKIKAFTMIEILIISIVISTGLFAIFLAANHAKLVNQRIMQTIIANQLATEGTEIIYQTRNTNFLRYNIDKEEIRSCRITTNYEECIKGAIRNGYLSDMILNTGNYYIETNENGKNIIKACNEEGCDDPHNPKYAICLKDGVRNPCPEGHELGGDESRYGKFFRMIEGLGIYDMSTDIKGGTQIFITTSDNYIRSSSQEFRFCSRVYRAGGQDGEIEICSTMTNFIE